MEPQAGHGAAVEGDAALSHGDVVQNWDEAGARERAGQEAQVAHHEHGLAGGFFGRLLAGVHEAAHDHLAQAIPFDVGAALEAAGQESRDGGLAAAGNAGDDPGFSGLRD